MGDMPTKHIQRVDATTNQGEILTSLCGLLRPDKTQHLVSSDQATCKRCLTIYAEDNAPIKVEITTQKKEIRTTSATGGQKGVKEARLDLVPVGPLLELGVLFSRGARKYAEHQWRRGYEWSKAYSALQRHALAWQSGLDYDVCSNDPQGCQHVNADGNPFTPPAPDTCYNHTGAHHLTAVAWHCFTLLEFKDTHPDHDDRYKIDPLAGFDLSRNHIAFKE